jgi:DNA-binding NarL/FixJ family response regulator
VAVPYQGAVVSVAGGVHLEQRRHDGAPAVDGGAGEAPAITRRLITEFVNRTAPAHRPVPAALAGLTDREREVLVQVAVGRSNAELTESLYISRATAKTHVSNLLSKLGAPDRIQLVVLAYESGIVSPAGDSAT